MCCTLYTLLGRYSAHGLLSPECPMDHHSDSVVTALSRLRTLRSSRSSDSEVLGSRSPPIFALLFALNRHIRTTARTSICPHGYHVVKSLVGFICLAFGIDCRGRFSYLVAHLKLLELALLMSGNDFLYYSRLVNSHIIANDSSWRSLVECLHPFRSSPTQYARALELASLTLSLPMRD